LLCRSAPRKDTSFYTFELIAERKRNQHHNAAANFNMGLLKAEQEDLKNAEHYLKEALKHDPQMAQAEYNLCVIVAKDRVDEAMEFCRKASELQPDNPKYAYTLAFFLDQKGETDEAVRVLNALILRYPTNIEAQMLLKKISDKK
jgi:predicted Zn-dependent protease